MNAKNAYKNISAKQWEIYFAHLFKLSNDFSSSRKYHFLQAVISSYRNYKELQKNYRILQKKFETVEERNPWRWLIDSGAKWEK